VVPSESLEKALFKAVKDGDAVKVGELLSKGASADSRDAVGWTPLYNAAVMGHTDIAMLLFEKGADVNARSSVGLTPLHLAAAEGRAETIRLLLESGADPSVESLDGKTPLDLARESKHADVVRCISARRLVRGR